VDIPVGRMPKVMHASEKDDVCFHMLLNAAHPAEHIHDDINSRLSYGTLKALSSLKEQASTSIGSDESDPTKLRNIGDRLLDSYLAELNKPSAFLQKSFCQHLSFNRHACLNIIRVRHVNN
jgi:hypothetical protein